jgi:chromosome partitioning protein
MPCIVAVAQRKGGVGKTTLAVSIAAELSARANLVALVDTDPQRSASEWARPGLLGFPVYAMDFRESDVGGWARSVRSIGADYLIIDTAPAGRAVGASVAISDILMVPCTPSGLDLESTGQTLAIVGAVRERRAARLAVILVPNRVDSRTLEGRQIIDELASFGETVGPPIGNRAAFVRAFSSGCSVADLAPGEAGDLEIRALCDLLAASLQ